MPANHETWLAYARACNNSLQGDPILLDLS